jgi:hypothetical protein
VPITASAGHVSRRFDGRLDGRKLKRGSYRLTIDAVDTAGNHAAPVKVAFKIAR